MKNELTLSKERRLTEDIHKQLEQSYEESKGIDKEISRTLGYYANPMKNVPVLGRVVKWGMGVKPLITLETTLQSSFRKSLDGMAKLGKSSIELKDRVELLKEVREEAKEQNWTPAQYLQFMEDNGGLNFSTTVDGDTYDFKELIAKTYALQTGKQQEMDSAAYQKWFESHIQLTDNYSKGMESLVLVGSKWLGNIAQSYYDLANLREGMVLIDRTMKVLGQGSSCSISTHEALGQYGKTYAKGIGLLLDGFEKMESLRLKQKDTFTPVIENLENRLNLTDESRQGLLEEDSSEPRAYLN